MRPLPVSVQSSASIWYVLFVRVCVLCLLLVDLEDVGFFSVKALFSFLFIAYMRMHCVVKFWHDCESCFRWVYTLFEMYISQTVSKHVFYFVQYAFRYMQSNKITTTTTILIVIILLIINEQNQPKS